jgi:hypothetical protein
MEKTKMEEENKKLKAELDQIKKTGGGGDGGS